MLLWSILSILLSCQKQRPMQFDTLPYLRVGVLSTGFRKFSYESWLVAWPRPTHLKIPDQMPGFSRHSLLAPVFRRWGGMPKPALGSRLQPGFSTQRIHP